MKNTKSVIRPQFTMEKGNRVLNTLGMDYTTMHNTVTIPFGNVSFRDYYEWLVQTNAEQLESISVNEALEQPYDLFLFIEAQDGHQIYNFDGQYNYYICAIIGSMDEGFSEMVKQQITDITDAEKEYIQNIIWNHRPVNEILKLQVENVITNVAPDRPYQLFSHSVEGNEYHGVFKLTDNNTYIFATVKNYNNGTSPIFVEMKTV